MNTRNLFAGALLAGLSLFSAAFAQGLTAEQAKDLVLDAIALEVAEEICDNVDIDEDDLVEIGEMKHFLRAKAGISKTELGAAHGALEAEAKKGKAAYCAGIKQSYDATYKKLVAATD